MLACGCESDVAAAGLVPCWPPLQKLTNMLASGCVYLQDLCAGSAGGCSAGLQHLCLCVRLGSPDAPAVHEGTQPDLYGGDVDVGDRLPTQAHAGAGHGKCYRHAGGEEEQQGKQPAGQAGRSFGQGSGQG